jgi:serine/threonine protein kinase
VDATFELQHPSAVPSGPPEVDAESVARLLAKLRSSSSVGRLKLERKIGEGAMGVVYRARDPDLERDVAVKILHPDSTSREDRIVAEARALAQLSHPGVVTIYDIGSSEAGTYLTMEYVDGGTLRTWLEDNGDAPWTEVLDLFLQAARGLHAAHDAGVVHQDFKPENVLVGSDGRVRVADFGLARGEMLRGSETLVGGTPRYMAPEVKAGTPATSRSDQYSFCIALKEAMQSGEPSRLGGGGVPARLFLVLARGLAEDPDRRWPSMAALIDALSRIAESKPDDHRHRTLILDRIEKLWLRGMLADSLGGHDPVPLNVEPATGLVTPPWSDLGIDAVEDCPPRTLADLPATFAAAGQSLLVVGAGGAGKTTALLTLARSLLDAARANPLEPAPIILPIASFDPKRSTLSQWVIAELVTKYSLPSRWARAWMEDDSVALLLDGLDEVPTSRRAACVQAIDEFRRDHPIPVVVTSREEDYVATGTKFHFGSAIRLLPLGDEQIRVLLERAGASAIVEALHDDPDLYEQLHNPLMLGILVVASAELSAKSARALGTALYRRYVDRALARGRARAPYTPEQTRAGLAWLARVMVRRGVTDVWLERLQANWLDRPTHRGAALGLGAVAIATTSFLGTSLPQLWAGLDPTPAALVSAIGVVFVFILMRGLRVRPVERLGWSGKRALRWLPITIGLAIAGALVMAGRMLILGPDSGMVEDDARVLAFANIVVGGLMGLAGGVVLGVEPGDREVQVRPNAGITQSLRNGLLIAIPSALVVAFLLVYVAIPLLVGTFVELRGPFLNPFGLWVRYAVLFGFLMFFVYGGGAAFLHGAIRCVLALTTPMPLDLVRFLDHAADRGLLRRIGGGYMFMHRTLRDHFAERGSLVSAEASRPSP